MSVSIGEIVVMKNFRHNFNKTDWMSYKHPQKDRAFVFMFMGDTRIDGSEPVKYCEIMAGLGWGDLEKFQRANVCIPRELTAEEWSEVSYNVNRKTSSDTKEIPIWVLQETVKYAEFIAGYRVNAVMLEADAPPINYLADHGDQIIKDAIRSAYDQGYNDCRISGDVAGDTAKGYQGRARSGEISYETIGRLRHNSTLNLPADTSSLETALAICKAAFEKMLKRETVQGTDYSARTAVFQGIARETLSVLNRHAATETNPHADSEGDTLRKENENLRRIIRDNWCGQYWRAVNHDHADEINASLNPCAEQIIPVRGRDIKETTR